MANWTTNAARNERLTLASLVCLFVGENDDEKRNGLTLEAEHWITDVVMLLCVCGSHKSGGNHRLILLCCEGREFSLGGLRELFF